MAKLIFLAGLRNESGWTGTFTRAQAIQAKYKNGARVQKAINEEGDATPLGVPGTVLGSIFYMEQGVGYFVEWDNRPKVAVFVVAWKLKPYV